MLSTLFTRTNYLDQGNALVAQNKLEEAIACCDNAISANPNHALAYYNKGVPLSTP